jgi:hypothetical protein
MKIALFFARQKPRRTANRGKTSFAEMTTTWTTREWADMPAHHPKKD